MSRNYWITFAFYVGIAALMTFFIYDTTRAATNENRASDIERCEQANDARGASNDRFEAQRNFLVQYEMLLTARAEADAAKGDHELARQDRSLARNARIYREKTVDYEMINCNKLYEQK